MSKKTKGDCPHCGRCKHCGRPEPVPYYPYHFYPYWQIQPTVQPQYPQPYITWTTDVGGVTGHEPTLTVSNGDSIVWA